MARPSRALSSSAEQSAPDALAVDPMLDPDVPADSVVATEAHDARDFDFERYVANGRPMYLRADAVELRRAEAAKAAARESADEKAEA